MVEAILFALMGPTAHCLCRINAVDVLFSAFPMFITLNPELGKYLLVPLLDYQNDTVSGTQSMSSAMQDLGKCLFTLILSPYLRVAGPNYPNATVWQTTNPDLGIEGKSNVNA